MTQFLPPNLLALFAARDPIPYLPPVDKLPYEKKTAGYTGVAAFVNEFEDPKTTPPPLRIETREERRERMRTEKAEQVAYKLEQDIAVWNPTANPAATSDPYKTLFVARVKYETSEAKLRREFEMYGNIKKIVITADESSKRPRGYAFIEYEREKDMHSAYKHADGRKIDSRRVLVDVERGRTVKNWLPRRLGGGLGGTRRGGPDVNLKHSGREERPEDRYMNRDRERERPERPERHRSRSRSRERRRRSRTRSRERHRGDRHKRDRSRDRERTRDLDTSSNMEKGDAMSEMGTEVAPEPEAPRKERRRSRSRDRDRRRSRRSRSRDRKRKDYDRDREGRRERGDRERGDRNRGDQDDRPVVIKEEPQSADEKQENFDNNGGYEGDYNNYNNSMESAPYEGFGMSEMSAERALEPEAPRKERRRSRSRDRDRRRSRSRDRKRKDHDRDRESRRERGDRNRGDQDDRPVAIKEEPQSTDERQENFDNNEGYEGNYNNNMEGVPYEDY